MFDLPREQLAERLAHTLTAELPEVGGDWTIGAIVGPSGSGKSTLARAAYGDAVDEPRQWPEDEAIVDVLDAEPSGVRSTAIGSPAGNPSEADLPRLHSSNFSASSRPSASPVRRVGSARITRSARGSVSGPMWRERFWQRLPSSFSTNSPARSTARRPAPRASPSRSTSAANPIRNPHSAIDRPLLPHRLPPVAVARLDSGPDARWPLTPSARHRNKPAQGMSTQQHVADRDERPLASPLAPRLPSTTVPATCRPPRQASPLAPLCPTSLSDRRPGRGSDVLCGVRRRRSSGSTFKVPSCESIQLRTWSLEL